MGGTRAPAGGGRARRACGRFVHTSTVGVHGARASTRPRTRRSPIAPGDIYQETKAEARARWRWPSIASAACPSRSCGRARSTGPGERRLLKLFRAIARGRYAIVGSRPRVLPPRLHRRPPRRATCWRWSGRRRWGRRSSWPGPRYVTQRELARRHRAATPAGACCPSACRRRRCAGRARCARPSACRWASSRRCTAGAWSSGPRAARSRSRRPAALLGYAPKVDLDEGVARTARVVPRGGLAVSDRAARVALARVCCAAGRGGVCDRPPPAVLGGRRHVPRDGLEPGRGRRPRATRRATCAACGARSGTGPQGIFLKRTPAAGGRSTRRAGLPLGAPRARAGGAPRIYFAKAFVVPGGGGAVREAVRHARAAARERRVPRPGARGSGTPSCGGASGAGLVRWRSSWSCFLATVAPLYLLWPAPEVFNVGLIAAGLVAWRAGVRCCARGPAGDRGLLEAVQPVAGAAAGRGAAARVVRAG